MRVVILGLGNTLLSDEGAGVHVVRALAADGDADDPDTELIDGGTLSFSLAAPIGAAEALVVVDAARLGEAPGGLRVFEGAAMDGFLSGGHRASVHEVALSDLMDIARLTDTWPACRALVAIEPATMAWGVRPSAAVAAAIPEACTRVRGLVEGWRHGQA